jgi:hypothetical protein
LLIGAGVLLALLMVAGAVVATQNKSDSHAAARDDNQGRITTINGLNNIAMVGSTQDILDKNGNKITANPDPYGVAIAPDWAGNGLKKGDLLVTNLGNDKKGMTIVKYANQKGPGVVFNNPNTDGTLGPTMLNFDQDGKLWVANSTGNDLLVFNSRGTVVNTVKSPLFNGPWGVTINDRNSVFVSNKLDAKILRVDFMGRNQGANQFKVTQIAQFDKMPDATKIALIWQPALKVGNRTLRDVLLALDPTNNRIAALPNSSKLNMMNGNQNMSGIQNTTGNQNVNGDQNVNGTQNANATQTVNGTQDANGNQITTQAPNTQAAMATQVAQAANGNQNANATQTVNGTQNANGTQVTTQAPNTQAAIATQVANNNNGQATTPVQTTNAAQGMGMGVTVFQGKPLNTPGGFTLNPINGDLLVTNLADNNLVELNMNKQTVVGVKQIDPMAVDNQGNGSALFGVVAIKDGQGNLRVFFTDDNTNSLNVLSAK